MTIIFSRATAQLIQKQELPADAIEVSLESAKIIQSALVQDLPFELLADGTVTVAPTPQHKYYKDKDRWIDYAYQYSASTGARYPSDMLDQYADKPADLQPITADVYAEIVAARSKGLSFVVKSDGESVNVAPSVAHVWDAKTGKWALDKAKQAALDKQANQAAFDKAKADKAAEINNKAQSYIDHTTGADQLPAFEVQSWAIQGAEAKAWKADPSAPTPTLESIAKNRGVPLDALRAGAYKKTMMFEAVSATVTGQRQKYSDQLRAAKTLAEVEAINVIYG